MLYREVGQFKTSYAADQAIFPILQDRIGLIVILLIAFVAIPLAGNDYWLRTILTPFLIFALAAIGLNLLTGYAGQVSLGTGGFMGVGAYAAYNIAIWVPVAQHLCGLRARGPGGGAGWASCSACRRFASRASTWRSPRWRRSSFSNGRSSGCHGSRTTARRAL